MKLADLDPVFISYLERDGHTYLPNEKSLSEAMGIMFLCPICFAANGGPVGTHQVICWSAARGAPEHAQPRPGRWTIDGTGFDDLTLNGEPLGQARSVQVISACQAHFHITNGEVT